MKNKILSSKTLSIISIILTASMFILPPALVIIVLPISLILGIFSVIQAKKEKSSLTLGVVAVILPFLMFFLIRFLLNTGIDRRIKNAYEKDFSPATFNSGIN